MISLFRRMRARLKYRHFERDLAREIDVHRAMKQEEIEAAGISGAEAHSRAARALGNVTYMREQARLIRLGAVGRMVDHLQADLRDAGRSLLRNPAFTAVTIGVLALGIGLNAAIFSVVQPVFLPPTQAASPATLVYVSSDRAIRLRDFHAGTREAFRELATHGPVEDVVVAGGRAARRAGEQVTANYFDVIGVPPAIGRAFHLSEDDGANPARAVVISHAMWTQTLGSNPDSLGSDVQIGDRSFRIVGIAPEGFNGLSAPWEPSAYWVTRAQYFGDDNPEIARTAAELGRHLVARLQSGVSVDKARAIAAAYGSASAPDSRSQLLRVEASENILLPFSDGNSERWLRGLASTVMGIGLLVLLIAGTNIAGVMSARGVMRRREFAVRQALGADGWRLVQQRLAESLLVASGGGIAGVGLAGIFVRIYRAASPAEFALDASLDAGVLTFTTIVCLGTGFLLGLAPALQARRPDLLKTLAGGAGAGIPRHERRRLQIGVLLPQILFAVVLMVVGSAYASTLLRMEFPEKGYRSENVVAATVGYVDVAGPSQRPAPTVNTAHDLRARRRRFDDDLLLRLRQTPGLTAAALVSRLPSDHMGTVNNRWVSDDGGVSAEGVPAEGSWVSSGYFDTFDVPLIRGRDFDDTDSFGSPAVAIISESLAKRLWPNGDALGRSFGHVGATRGTGGSGWYQWKQVVGIAADTRSPLQSQSHRPYLYTPLTQADTWWGQMFAVATGPAGVMSALRTVIEADPLARVLQIETIDQTIDREMYPLRAAAWLLGVSGASGLLLAALGLYGVVTHSVAQQTREFGIRATLGASSGALVRHVLLSGARVAAFAAVPGVVLGLVGLRVATRFATMAPTVDPIAIAAVLTFIASVVVVACYIPARRAGRINPVTTLRAD